MKCGHLGVVIAAAILLAGCVAKGTAKETAQGPSAPSISPAADSQLRPTTGIDDIAKTGLQVVFAEPAKPAKLSEDEAKAVAVQHFGAPPAGSAVTVEYKLLTDDNNESRPVYAVTYHDLPPVPSSGPVPSNSALGGRPFSAPSQAMRLTVFVDANSGDYLYAVER